MRTCPANIENTLFDLNLGIPHDHLVTLRLGFDLFRKLTWRQRDNSPCCDSSVCNLGSSTTALNALLRRYDFDDAKMSAEPTELPTSGFSQNKRTALGEWSDCCCVLTVLSKMSFTNVGKFDSKPRKLLDKHTRDRSRRPVHRQGGWPTAAFGGRILIAQCARNSTIWLVD
jgi:hypothetical protein